MTDQTEELDDDDRRLMLRVAGELASRESEALDAQLATSPELRRRLEELERLERSAYSAIDQLDRRVPMPQRRAVVRNAVRAIEQWNNQRLASEAARRAVRPQMLASRWWMYPVAAAAIVLIAMIIWWGNVGDETADSQVATISNERLRFDGPLMQHAFADHLTSPSLDLIEMELSSLTFIRESMH